MSTYAKTPEALEKAIEKARKKGFKSTARELEIQMLYALIGVLSRRIDIVERKNDKHKSKVIVNVYRRKHGKKLASLKRKRFPRKRKR